MSQLINFRQTRLRELLSMIGNTANEAGNSVLSKIDAELAKLFEDRNVLLTDGGLITFTGTQLQFTEALKLTLNQKISGAAPQVIDLAATTRTVSASGRMIYAVIDRGAGTATVTDDATTLPAAVAANQEVFLIAKRVDATDGTQRIYFRSGMALNAGQTVRLGSSGSGSGGDGVLNPIPGYQWLEIDTFDVLTASSDSKVTGTNYTNGVQNIGKSLYRLSCDKTRTVATNSGIALTINLAPSFTVAVGDIAYITSGARSGQWRRISAVGSQTSFTLDAAFSGGDASAADTIMISQAVWTKDLVNLGSASEKTRARDFFSGNITQIAIDYFDSLTVDDDVPDLADTARIVASASNSGLVSDSGVPASNLFSPIFTRVAYPGQINDYTLSTNSNQQRLHVVFFCNPSNGSVTSGANLLKYETNFFPEAYVTNGGTLESAYAYTDGAGTEVNCDAPSVVSGKTRLKLGFSYIPNVNSGRTKGQLRVALNGQDLPRFISGSTTDAYYKEIQNSITGVYDTIEFHADLSGFNYSIEVTKSEGVVDTNTQNTADIASINSNIDSLFDKGFQDFVETPSTLTAITGSPGSGQFRTFGIVNRASIPDLSNDLSAYMGINRLMVQQVYEIPNEIGPNGERVYGALNDSKNQIRVVGNQVSKLNTTDGQGTVIDDQNGFIEIVFWGTGLNLLGFYNSNNTRDFRATVDGGAEGGNLYTTGGSAILQQRGNSMNAIYPIASGLSLGLHSVKIRNAGSAINLIFYGFEILNESTSLKVNTGAAYIDGRRTALGTLSASSFSSGFTNTYGTPGSKGGHVLVYMDSSGIKKDVRYTEVSQLNLTSADHTNEELIREYHWREFGSGRTDDFSTLGGTQSNRMFVLDDDTTALRAQQVFNSNESLNINSTNDFISFTFVGTGLDIMVNPQSAITHTTTVLVDNSSIGTISSIPVSGTIKIVSGLPYGTHTVQLLRSTPVTGNIALTRFMVYGPKKPVLPADSIELADYYLMASFVANAVGSPSSVIDSISTGVLRKYPMREFYYNGASWAIGSVDVTFLNGFSINASTNGNYLEYTFVGTGFDFRVFESTGSGNFTMTLDGSSDFSGFTTSHVGPAGTSITSTNPMTVDGIASSGSGFASVIVQNIPYGKHTLRVTTSGIGLNPCAIDVITPIHSPKNNFEADIQNTLPIGSCGISDNRLYSPVKKEISSKKAWAQAIGIISAPTTTSTSYVPVPDMAINLKMSKDGEAEIAWACDSSNSSAGASVNGFTVYIDGVAATIGREVSQPSANHSTGTSDKFVVPLSKGTHRISLMWLVGTGTGTANGVRRIITAREL